MKIEKMNRVNLSCNNNIYWLRFNGENHQEIIESLDIGTLGFGTIIEKDNMILKNKDFEIELKINDILIYFGGKALQIIDQKEFNTINFFLKQLEKIKGE